jgi:hypothetical protein
LDVTGQYRKPGRLFYIVAFILAFVIGWLAGDIAKQVF